ncbi:MAG: hypothetical protein LBJ63_01785 [Prevotellaceae bacterium]|jgi:hypothetical protein|nr:hypothetical protein [Prevotellaceae bacterium]
MKKTKLLTIIASICLLTACSGTSGKLTPFAEPQEYVGSVSFENSKNVELRFILSADAKQITEIKLTADELSLTPENAGDRQEKKQAEGNAETAFVFLENTTARTSIDTRQDEESGYNVMSTDSQGNSAVKEIMFKGGFKSESPVELNGGKLYLDAAPLIIDLTVTNERIYGNVKFEFQSCGTKSVYAVFKNTTTPQ